MARILIVDDDELFCGFLSQMIKAIGHEPEIAFTLHQGLLKAQQGDFSIVLLDIGLPDGSGLDILRPIKACASLPEVIIITGAGDPDGAELAINTGAWDYLEKPFSKKSMELTLLRTLEFHDKKIQSNSTERLIHQGIIGRSAGIADSIDRMAKAAQSDINLLITGETGTGKELFAKAVHRLSNRSKSPFIVVDCAALPDSLVDSVLFGHTKGAFTGADMSKEGLVKLADGGTLFMDEVGELPGELQKKFLRVLQERRFLPVGGRKEVTSDFRLISATNRNLDDQVAQGKFRQDLLFRIRSFTIHLPPLREREEDIVELSSYYIRKACKQFGIEPKQLTDECIHALKKYNWPGNVRELFNTLESALVSSDNDTNLHIHDLPVQIRAKIARASVSKKSDSVSLPAALPLLKDFRESMEKQYLSDLISLYGRNIKQACEASGLSQSRFYGLLKKYGLSISDLPET